MDATINQRLDLLLRELRALVEYIDAMKINNGASTPEKRQRAQVIVLAVSGQTDIPAGAIYSSLRGTASEALTRQICMTLIRAKLGLSTHEVGGLFRRDHKCVVHAEKCVNDRIATDSKFASRFAQINIEVENKLNPKGKS